MDAFWRQTPRLFDLAILAKARAAEDDHKRAAWQALTTAALIRRDRKAPWPTVEQLTGKAMPAAKKTPAEMKAAFAALRETLAA